MSLKEFKPLLTLSAISLLLFVIHKIIFVAFLPNLETQFNYTLIELYLFYAICSFVILIVLIIVNTKNINNVGYTFLLLTCIKMGVAYVFLLPILNSKTIVSQTEKTNFFIVFALFLAIETILTIRILNKKQ